MSGAAEGPKKEQAGVWRDINRHKPNYRSNHQIVKTKAHRKVDEIEDLQDRLVAMGNAMADELAKEAAAGHALNRDRINAIDDVRKFRVKVIVAMATVQAQLPGARDIYKQAEEEAMQEDFEEELALGAEAPAGGEHQGHPDLPAGAEPAGGQAPGALPEPIVHDWEAVDARWRCRRCLRQSGRRDACRVVCGDLPPPSGRLRKVISATGCLPLGPSDRTPAACGVRPAAVGRPRWPRFCGGRAKAPAGPARNRTQEGCWLPWLS